MKVGETLKLDPQQEIDTVVSVDNLDQEQVISELNEYIVTDQLGDYFLEFLSKYNEGTENTCVWISGFYGSGKSYFAKILGYLLENPELKGAPARERYTERLYDLSDAEFIRNELDKLDRLNTKTTMLNLSKMTDRASKHGLARTFYEEFLNSRGFKGKYLPVGQIEMELFQRGDYNRFKEKVEEQQEKSWKEIKEMRGSTLRNVIADALTMLFPEQYSKDNFDLVYQDILDGYGEMDASMLADELNKYLRMQKGDHRIVLIVDEIGQFVRGGQNSGEKMLELQGIAESFKDEGQGKLWLVVTAQEKLEHIVDEVGVRQTDFAKISDRFQLKMHLTSEDVQKVLDERIFRKTNQGEAELTKLFQEESSNIPDLADPDSSRELPNARTPEKFVKDYPLLPYQRSTLPRVLYSTREKGRAGGTERGMIDVTFSLVKEISEEPIFRLPSHPELFEACGEAVGSDSQFKQRLRQADEGFVSRGDVFPSDVMRTIFFLDKTAGVKRTIDNISRGIIKNVHTSINEVRTNVQDILRDLVEGKEVIEGEEYSLANEADKKLINALDKIHVTVAEINKRLREEVMNQSFLDKVNRITLEKGNTFTVSLTYGENGRGSSSSPIKLVLLPPNFDSESERERKIEELEVKSNAQRAEATVYLVPEMIPNVENTIAAILKREKVRDDFQSDVDPEMRNALADWNRQIQNQYLPRLKRDLEDGYYTGTLIVKGKLQQLDESTFTSRIRDELKQRANHLYSERIKGSKPTDPQVTKLLRAKPEDRIEIAVSEEFQFFDAEGHFVGEHMKVTSDILKICTNGVSGKQLEVEFKDPPYGWDLQVVKFGIAALFVADQIEIRYQNDTFHSHRASELIDFFQKTRPFREAEYKSVKEGVPLSIKNKAVDKYNELIAGDNPLEAHVSQFKLEEEVRRGLESEIKQARRVKGELASSGIQVDKIENHLNIIRDLIKTGKDTSKSLLCSFVEKESLSEAINYLDRIDQFRAETLQDLKLHKDFVRSVKSELDKTPESFNNPEALRDKINHLLKDFQEDPIQKVKSISETRMEVWDAYQDAIKPKHKERNKQYEKVLADAKRLKGEVTDDKVENTANLLPKINNIIKSIQRKICNELKVSNELAVCVSCSSGLSEIKSDIDAASSLYQKLNSIREQIKNKNVIPSKTLSFQVPSEMDADEFLTKVEEKKEEIREAKKEAEEVKLKFEIED